MARKLVWTQLVRQQMKEAFDYYNKRNDSKTYSRFLKNEFLVTMRLVAKIRVSGIRQNILTYVIRL